MGAKRNRDTGKSRNNKEKHFTMGITRSDSPKEKCTQRTSQKENVHRLKENKQVATGSHQGCQQKKMHLTHTTPEDR